MTDYTSIVLLCEDRQQEVFARQFLRSRGIEKHQIYPDVNPKGKGAGEQYVREKYPRYVKSYREKAIHLSNALVVLTDADNLTVQARLQCLADELQKSGEPPRAPKERIGVFVPKRNIETWIYFLQGQSVDEETAYPKFTGNESVCKPYVKALAQNYRQPLPDYAPTSLTAACRETARIFPEDG